MGKSGKERKGSESTVQVRQAIFQFFHPCLVPVRRPFRLDELFSLLKTVFFFASIFDREKKSFSPYRIASSITLSCPRIPTLYRRLMHLMQEHVNVKTYQKMLVVYHCSGLNESPFKWMYF